MKSKSKKTNPRRRPLSEADVVKIQDNAVHLAFAIFLIVLKDKFSFTNEDIIRAWKEADKLSEEVLKDGLVKLKDLIDVLRTEYGIDLQK